MLAFAVLQILPVDALHGSDGRSGLIQIVEEAVHGLVDGSYIRGDPLAKVLIRDILFREDQLSHILGILDAPSLADPSQLNFQLLPETEELIQIMDQRLVLAPQDVPV